MSTRLVLVVGAFLALGVVGFATALTAAVVPSGAPPRATAERRRARRRRSGIALALATMHPFRVDFRVALGAVVAGAAAIAHAWLLVVPSIAIGYVSGDLFLTPALQDAIEELSSMLQFIVDFRAGLLAGGVSVSTALELALSSQPGGRFTQLRRSDYRVMADPSAREVEARVALRRLVGSTTNPFIHATDLLVYLALRATNLRVASQLDLLGDILLQQVQAYRGLVVSELVAALGEARLITVITVGTVYVTLIALGGPLASDLGLSILAQVTALAGIGAQLLWALSLRRDFTFKLRYL